MCSSDIKTLPRAPHLIMSIPASSSLPRVSSLQHFGPIVQTMRVLRLAVTGRVISGKLVNVERSERVPARLREEGKANGNGSDEAGWVQIDDRERVRERVSLT